MESKRADSPHQTLAERLGFSKTDRIAIVHCDDIGMCHAANQGAFEALDRGPATCGSVMVPCPWFPEAAAMARERPGIDLGVHLTLTSEWPQYRWGPVLGAAAVPSLVDAQGCFPRSTAEAVAGADLTQVEVELRAQVDRALASGIDVTHLDAHMGTALMPPLLEVYAQIALDYRLPVFAIRPDPTLLAALGQTEASDGFTRILDDFEAGGGPILDAMDANSLHFEPGEGAAHNAQRLSALQAGVSYLICHPAKGGEELDAIAPDAHCRDFERSYFGGDAGAAALATEGIHTLGMRPLRDLMRGA